MNKATKDTLNSVGVIYSLTLALLFIFTISFSSAVICNENIPNGCPSTLNSISNVNNTYQNITNINQSNTFNSTQFDSTGQITIRTSWLRTFINWVLGDGVDYIKLNSIAGACDLTVNHTICSNATGTYIVG